MFIKTLYSSIKNGILRFTLYLIRPFLWWMRKDKQDDHLSYAMSIEAIPNPQGWITGAIISFYVECDITGNNTEFERIYNFNEKEIIYTTEMLTEEEAKNHLSKIVNDKIDLKEEARYARELINMQVLIEGITMWTLLFTIIAGILLLTGL